MQIRLHIGLDGQAEPIRVLSAVLASSSSMRESFVRLAPGETIGIKFKENIRNIRGEIPPEVEEVSLTVAINEWTSEDSQYFISFHDGRSETVLSANTVTLSVEREAP